jgi:3-isopropylmalate/(R)-2-methylmalate dehydratase small subunit
MEALVTLVSRTAVMPAANIDTDQIIPARFLTTTTRSGLGKHLFADWRYDAAGHARPEFVLNRPESQGCRILVAGRNFGCGSSREHAAWALVDYGFRAVIASEIADIFATNALKNGLLPVRLEATIVDALLAQPGAELSIDVASASVTLPGGRRVAFPLEPFVKECLMSGVDELGYLIKREPEISAFERRHA